MKPPTPHPLQWPDAWPKTTPSQRQFGAFKTDTASALRNLQKQLALMGAKGIVLSSNYTLGVENPKEPGVCAYFEYDGMQLAIPCDRWVKISHNIQAIALTVEAMRGMERWGAKHMIRAMFSGFKQLANGDRRPWFEVLGVPIDASRSHIKDRYRSLCVVHHPDKGGDTETMLEINAAMAEARSLGVVD